MDIRRRTLLAGVPATALLAALAACSSSGSGGTTSATVTALPTTSTDLVLDHTAWSHDADNDVYYQIGLSYVATPQSAADETLGIYVPGAYLTATDNGDGTFTAEVSASGSVGDWTAATAPIVYPVNTPGYAAQAAPTSYSYDAVSAYMTEGFVYVEAGLRGKESNGDGYTGNAPWGVTDLKSAIRYLRFNSALVPGDPEQVYVFGHSGGGAQSAVAGSSGDSALYTPYLEALGAAMTDTEGAALSDAVAGAMCWCPITSLDQANAAYEWNMGQFATTGTRAEGTWTQAYSQDLAAAYADYLGTLGLTDADGTALTLEESADGVYLAGTYYDHLVGVVQQSLNDFLAVTTFPYTPSSTEMAGMDSGSAPSGSAPTGVPDGASGTAPTGTAPTGSVPDGASGSAPGGASDSGTDASSSGTTSSATTYETVEDYVSALNAASTAGDWVTYDSATSTATVTSLGGFVTSQKNASKDVGAFDGVDRGQTENVVMGLGEDGLHFAQVSRDVIAAHEDTYAGLTGWSDDEGSSAYDEDLARTDSVGQTVASRVDMYNPMYYLNDAYDGAGTSTVAPHWRIRTGIQQGDTASTVEVNLALALAATSAVSDVDFATVWGQGHTMAELTGTGEENFIAWVKESAAA